MFILTVYGCAAELIYFKSPKASITRLFLRDGALWFLSVFTILIMALVRPSITLALLGFIDTIYSIVSSRILLNIKSALSADVVPETGLSLNGTEFDDVWFARQSELSTARLTRLYEPYASDSHVECSH